jgi:hypothetical protein
METWKYAPHTQPTLAVQLFPTSLLTPPSFHLPIKAILSSQVYTQPYQGFKLQGENEKVGKRNFGSEWRFLRQVSWGVF